METNKAQFQGYRTGSEMTDADGSVTFDIGLLKIVDHLSVSFTEKVDKDEAKYYKFSNTGVPGQVQVNVRKTDEYAIDSAVNFTWVALGH